MTTRSLLTVFLLVALSSPTLAKEAAIPEDSSNVVKGNSDFAFDLYARLSKEKNGNLFFSPNSISTALAMTYAGARGSTEAQMAKVLHFNLSQDRLHPAFAKLSGVLNSKTKSYQLKMANRLWGQKGYKFLPPFLKTTQEHYGAELTQLDFVSQTEESRKTINTWVEKQTEEKIKDLIPKGVLNELTRLVLTNAIYFKGDWASQFDKKVTRDAPFLVSASKKVTVPMMFNKGKFKYGANKELQILQLPYVGKDLAMLVLLPKKKDGLAALEKQLNAKNLGQWTFRLCEKKVNVFLPKFKMTSEFQLKSVLESMGMPLAFSRQSDFSGMNGKKDLFIAAVIHKAFVDVNEEGTEAAAATGVVVGVRSIQIIPTFRADHPFIFMIRDNRTKSILFMGRVVNPKP